MLIIKFLSLLVAESSPQDFKKLVKPQEENQNFI